MKTVFEDFDTRLQLQDSPPFIRKGVEITCLDRLYNSPLVGKVSQGEQLG